MSFSKGYGCRLVGNREMCTVQDSGLLVSRMLFPIIPMPLSAQFDLAANDAEAGSIDEDLRLRFSSTEVTLLGGDTQRIEPRREIVRAIEYGSSVNSSSFSILSSRSSSLSKSSSWRFRSSRSSLPVWCRSSLCDRHRVSKAVICFCICARVCQAPLMLR